jgi:hypothetical protein
LRCSGCYFSKVCDEYGAKNGKRKGGIVMSVIPYDTARGYTGEKADEAERLMWDHRMPTAFARRLASLLKVKSHREKKEQTDESKSRD